MTDLAFKNKALFYFFLLVLTVGGLFSFMAMSKLEDPEIVIKQALVVTAYPGASAHEVELEVTDVLEKAILTMGGLNKIESRSEADYSEIVVELHPTVSKEDVEQKWDILRRRVESTIPDLPAGALRPMVVDDFGDVYGLFYAMTSDGFSHEEMYDYGRLVKQELEQIEDVKRVEMYGNRKPAIYIKLDQAHMAGLGVHPAEVLMTLNDQNETVYAGYFETGDERIPVRIGDAFQSMEDIKNLVIHGHEGDQIRLSDIATLERGLEEPYREAMRHNKMPALGISIAMESGGNVIELGDRVDERLAELKNKRIPAGIDFSKVFFQPDKVSDAIATFMFNLLQSVLIVIVILMLAMGWRSGFIIGSGLLLTILGTLAILNLFDGTLQRVSLGSFIIAMGMLVDNAVVIVDGIITDLEKGVKKEKALFNPVRKTAIPLLGATLIAILAFLPIFMSPDTAGEYVRDLFIVLAVSLLLSWILALTQAPVMASFQFKPSQFNRDNKKKPYSGRVYRLHRNLLGYLLWHKSLAVIAALTLLGISIFMFRYVPQTFFPDMSYSQLYIEYRMPAGTRIEKVDADIKEIEEYLLGMDDVVKVTASLGGTPTRYNLVRFIATPSMSYGELIIEFTNFNALQRKAPEIQDHLLRHYPQAYARVQKYNFMYMEFPIEVMFTGPDPGTLRQLTAQAREIMENEPTAVLVTDDWEPATKSLVAGYNQMNARAAGLSRSDVAMAMLASTDGLPIGNLYEGRRAIPIILRQTEWDGSRIRDLETAPVFPMMPATPAADPELLNAIMAGIKDPADILRATVGAVPMRQAIDEVMIDWEEPVVRRYNGQRAMKAQSNPIAGKTADAVRKAMLEEIQAIELPPGYNTKWYGEYKASSESQEYLFMYLPLAVVLMIAILIAMFRDYRNPLIIILSLPLAFVGIVPGMLITGREFGFVAIVGALGLMGMMIKNGVVLLREVAIQIDDGKKKHQALLDASSSRLRPVMMASLTTILGMIPLIPDDMFGSMAVTMMSGLLLGSVITLMIMPVLYAVFFQVNFSKGMDEGYSNDTMEDDEDHASENNGGGKQQNDNDIVSEAQLIKRAGRNEKNS